MNSPIMSGVDRRDLRMCINNGNVRLPMLAPQAELPTVRYDRIVVVLQYQCDC